MKSYKTKNLRLRQGNCIYLMSKMEPASVDLVITSPPYHGKTQRYGTNKTMDEYEWTDWMFNILKQCIRVSRGMVVIVANGCVRKGQYIPTVERLLLKAYDYGIPCERPVLWHKNSPPSRKDWFGNDWEYCLAFGRKTTWNWEAIAEPPKYTAGGRFRQRDSKGERKLGGEYPTNKLARPRDVLRVTVGGGHLGSKLAHENEAPFPEKLVEPFILSLTNKGDTVLDPMCGSGTTLSVSLRNHRKAIGFDIRENQISLSLRRITQDIEDHGGRM